MTATIIIMIIIIIIIIFIINNVIIIIIIIIILIIKERVFYLEACAHNNLLNKTLETLFAALQKKFNFCFLDKTLAKVSFWMDDWAQSNNSVKFWDFPDFS